jgi:two-component system chemotaxis response regulator CheB
MQSKSVVVAVPDPRERQRLCRVVNRMPEFTVIADAGDLMQTYTVVEARLPKAVLIADVLAEQPEFEVMRGLFSTLDIRWLVVSGGNRPAARVPPAPPGADLFALPAEASEEVIARHLLSLTRSALAPRPPAKPRSAPAAGRSGAPAPQPRPRPAVAAPAPPPEPVPGSGPVTPATAGGRVILIGSSTGGVDALLTVLSGFPADCPPTLVVQHTGPGFGPSLAGLLDRQCPARVQLARGAARLSPGVVTVGAGLQAHLVIEDPGLGTIGLLQSAPVSGHMPSVDMLFRSAVALGPRVSAALLTGMGRDGAEGLRALRAAGAHTIAQDEETSVVYGMPRAAAALGAAQQILPLKRIGPALLKPPGPEARATGQPANSPARASPPGAERRG